MIVGDESVQTVLNGWRPEVPEELQDYNWDKANVNELHVRKHLCESLFKSKCFLLSFWVPLLTGVIVYVFPVSCALASNISEPPNVFACVSFASQGTRRID